MADAHGGHESAPEIPPKFLPRKLWPEGHYEVANMAGGHHYLCSYHINKTPISWGTIIQKVKK